MTIKILVGECMQEVATFNPVRSRYADFQVLRGDALFAFHRGLNTEIAGALKIFATRDDLTLVPTYSARANTSGGVLGRADFARIAREFLEAMRLALPADAVYLALHGAMAAEGEEDPEGYLLEEVRNLTGAQIPIVVSLDLHGIVTERMLRHADAIVAYHTYPHVDFANTGERAAALLLRVLDRQVRPVTAFVPIPALVRGNELITATGRFGKLIAAAQAAEATPPGLAAGMFIGNPFTDVPALRSNSFVVADGDAAYAERNAVQLAADFWAVRQHLQSQLFDLAYAVETVQQTAGTVILVDAADATSSGASGDSNVIVRNLIDGGVTKRILAPIVDPQAVQAAWAAGVGGIVETTLGGKLDPGRFTPLPVTGRVQMLSTGRIISESNGAIWDGGTTAVLECGPVTAVVTSRPVHLFDRSLFYAHGQDPTRFDVVIVKSPHCQPRFFEEWAAALVNVDAPGSTSANLRSLGHTRCARPMFPLDGEIEYTPRPMLFSRQ
jgi:microcystin degradation protein MlrC